MIDFLMISTRPTKRGIVEIYPKFIIKNPSEHLMIRGGDFYAIWIEDRGLWSTNEQDALDIIDAELDRYAKENASHIEGGYRVLHMWDAESGMIDAWHRYCQRQMRDSFHMLDEKLSFANSETSRKDYASKRLPYPLEKGETRAWDRLMSVLYSEEERRKIEWAIGSVVSGESKKLQKFIVLYGSAGTGKSTVLNIIQQLFEGYTSVFDAKALGSSSNSFALEAFRSNPLVAIQHDGDLSHIEDNTRLNSLVSHEMMTVNEKFKSTYANKFICLLFMGTNKPVRITDAKSGLIRRLIDVSPTGDKIEPTEYRRLMKQIGFELGPIAWKCRDIFLAAPDAYDNYIPVNMLGASNDFYNFILDAWPRFKKDDAVSLKAAWAMYKTYNEDANVPYPYCQTVFKEELKNYFREYKERETFPDGSRIRSWYSGFLADKFADNPKEHPHTEQNNSWLEMREQPSILDDMLSDSPAQYASAAETPLHKWVDVQTTLKDLNTKKVHYVKVPENHIVIDFDIRDSDGAKCYEMNVKEAEKWPPTYAELSKGGQGIHLHYIYTGDVSRLKSVYGDQIEVKVFTGNSSLRRRLSRCNAFPVATISHGLPLKEEKKIVNFKSVQSERGIRAGIEKNLAKEVHAFTKPSIDMIAKILKDAYEDRSLSYDVSDMKNAVIGFAAQSSHQAATCLKIIDKMHFQSRDVEEAAKRARSVESEDDGPLIFFDVEVFPNLLLINWMPDGDDNPVVRMINPDPQEVERLMRHRLVGFNCRRYDNHILYARLMNWDNEQIYNLSRRIIGGDRGSFFGEAYDVSYTDVYDFASAGNKKSLKKFEIELGIHHQELGLPWDKPVPEDQWEKVAAYCDNDVKATRAVFYHLSADWTARQILASLADGTVNDSTNSLTTKIIFGGERKPQRQFHYRNLAEPVYKLDDETMAFLKNAKPDMMSQLHGEAGSLLPYFPGYVYDKGVSTYRGYEIGEGGRVYAEPGMYGNVPVLDVNSQHPNSTIAECLFGPTFTARYKEIVDGRINIKHQAWEQVNNMLDGKLTPFIQQVLNGTMTASDLANALKTAINSVYGLTSASFENPFRDPRNKDNIVAKRGALFMTDLQAAVEAKGFTVAHIKTDSIKIPDATDEIVQFVMNFGKKYGYFFELEDVYDKMCLVNDAVYIARYKTPHKDKKTGKEVWWTATGKQFAVPYVFKRLFSREPVAFEDMCETMSVSSALYLDMNEGLPDVSLYETELERRRHNKTHAEKPKRLNSDLEGLSDEDLITEIDKGHDYHFIGRVGQFCPIKSGAGGGVLLREANGKYASVSGSKGYRWMESEMVRMLHKEDDIDRSYYDRLVDEAKETISKYGDFEWFVSEDPYDVPPDGDSHDGI